MSACALRRWGAGTPCVKEPTTAAGKEMAAKLAAMRAERERQDAAFFPGAGTAVGQEELVVTGTPIEKITSSTRKKNDYRM
jgi:hypothetical protein